MLQDGRPVFDNPKLETFLSVFIKQVISQHIKIIFRIKVLVIHRVGIYGYSPPVNSCAKGFLSILLPSQVQLQSMFMPDMRFIFFIPSMIVVSYIISLCMSGISLK